jgi:hypothetical protein
MIKELPNVDIPDKFGYLIPLSDIHIGDSSFTEYSLKKLKGYINWVKEHKNSRVFLMGDLYNVATRTSKTSPFGRNVDEEKLAVDLFKPIREQICGVIRGNHENRIKDSANLQLLLSFCRILDIEDKYYDISQVLNFRVWKRKRKGEGGTWGQQYLIYFHHTSGGGSTVGGKINRAAKLREVVEGCDVYIGAHNHMLGHAVTSIKSPNIRKGIIENRPQHIVDAGGFVEWDNSYCEEKQLSPLKIGATRIRLDGVKFDVHVSL